MLDLSVRYVTSDVASGFSRTRIGHSVRLAEAQSAKAAAGRHTPHGGCSSGAERLTVAQEVAGSIPVTHPIIC